MAIFYIALGLLCGSAFNVKQVGGICGALLTNLSAWLSGVWFDLSLVGGFFEKIAYFLPFVHAVKLQGAILSGSAQLFGTHILPIIIYDAITLALAVAFFLRQMKKQ